MIILIHVTIFLIKFHCAENNVDRKTGYFVYIQTFFARGNNFVIFVITNTIKYYIFIDTVNNCRYKLKAPHSVSVVAAC